MLISVKVFGLSELHERTSVRSLDPPAVPHSLGRSACSGLRAGGCGCGLSLQSDKTILFCSALDRKWPISGLNSTTSRPGPYAFLVMRNLKGEFTLRGVLIQARWVKWESTDTPTTSQLTSWNSLALSLNEMISVGHTKVLGNKNVVL